MASRQIHLNEVEEALLELAREKALRLNRELFSGYVFYKISGLRFRRPDRETVSVYTLLFWLHDYGHD